MLRNVLLAIGLLAANVVSAQENVTTNDEAVNSYQVTVDIVELNDAIALFAYRHEAGILNAGDAQLLRELAEFGEVGSATFTLTTKPAQSAKLFPGRRWDFSMLTVDDGDGQTRMTVSHCLDDELPSLHEFLVDEGESLLLPRTFEYDDCEYVTLLSVKSLAAEGETMPSAEEQAALPVIHGVVRDAAGKPLPGMTVQLSDRGLYRFGALETVTDENGEYRFELGEYQFEVGTGFESRPGWHAWLHQVRVRVEHPTLVSRVREIDDRTWLPMIPGVVARKDIVLVPGEGE